MSAKINDCPLTWWWLSSHGKEWGWVPNVDCLGVLGSLHKFPGEGNRKNTENQRKLASFPFHSLLTFLFLLFCHLEFHTWTVPSWTCLWSPSLWKFTQTKMCWSAGNVDTHTVYTAVSCVFLVIDARFLKTMKPTPRSQRIFFKIILGSCRTSEILPASIGPGEDCFSYGTLDCIWDKDKHMLYTHYLHLADICSPNDGEF